MEKKQNNTVHHYYYSIYRYENALRAIWYGFIYALAHWPSMMIHVFTRKNMGERFFTLAAPISFCAILSLPFIFKNELDRLGDFAGPLNWFGIIFLGLYLAIAIERRLEFKRHSHEFDPEKFSKYEGDRLVYDWAIEKFKADTLVGKILGWRFVMRNFESLLFIITGLLLLLIPFSRLVGFLLVVSGLLDMAKTRVQFAKGRNYVLDQYDNVIVSREFKESFVNNKKPKDSKYLDLSHLPRSNNRQVNEMLADMINAQSAQPATE